MYNKNGAIQSIAMYHLVSVFEQLPFNKVSTLRPLRLGEEMKKIEETTGQKYNVRICYAGRP